MVFQLDDAAEVKRELASLKLDHWLDEDAGQALLIDPIPAPTAYAAHCGISIICDVVNRMLIAGNTEPAPIHLPISGSAQETNQQLSRHLRETAARHSDIAPFIDAFLAGELLAVTDRLKSLPVTRWEHFVIQCSVINREWWNVTP